LYYKDDWHKAKERLMALWEREIIDRCCIAVAAPKDGKTDVSVFAVGECDPNDPEDIKNYWEDGERILKRNIKRMENTFFGGEAIPQIMLNFGTSGHAIYFGANYSYSKDTIWYSPIIDDWNTTPLSFNDEHPFLKKQLEIAAYLAREGQGKFFVSMPDNCGTLDAIAHLRGSENVLIDMVCASEKLKEAIKIVNRAWKEGSERFYRITSQCNEGGSTVGWMDTWAPGRHAQMQCDLSVMISPAMYREFVVPELEDQMEWIEFPVYHFDGKEQIRHLEYLLSLPKLKMIQWTNVAGQEPPTAFIPVFKRIQQAGKCLLIFCNPSEIPVLLSELSSRGLYIHTFASSVEEAKDILKYVEHNTRD